MWLSPFFIVGSTIQIKAMKQVARKLKLKLAQFAELEAFGAFCFGSRREYKFEYMQLNNNICITIVFICINRVLHVF